VHPDCEFRRGDFYDLKGINHKVAWVIEDLDQDVGLAYWQMGRKGLEGIENVGSKMAEVVDNLF